jgi:diguanylate cyclase (GGDEF)-like protein
VNLDDELTSLIGLVYADHHGLPERVRAYRSAAVAVGNERHAALGSLILADLDNRAGRRAEGVESAYAVLSHSDDRVVIAHAHAVIAGGLWRLGDNIEAVKHAYEADRALVDSDPLCLRVDHALTFALQVNDQRLGKSRQEEYEVAQRLAERLGEPYLILANLNNWTWSSYADGRLADALALAQRMLDYTELVHRTPNTSTADTIARVFMADGQTARAAGILDDALAHAPSTAIDAVPACYITYAEIKIAEHDVPAAVRLLEKCLELTQRDHVPDQDAIARKLLAQCHAALGDYESAYREMVEFHEAWTIRRSEQSEALASVTHARFAIDEARRDSERFRELAERDALTGLWNRRRSDDHLAALLAAKAADRGPLSVAILDLDQFKRINDTHSHAVGDSVLVRVGDILRSIVEPVGYAARHGGEEFLLVIGAEADEAVRICEHVRTAVAGQAWYDIAPGLRVTASIGVTPLRPGDDAGSVLARADEHLYEAKSAGRNRVVQ